MKTNIILLVFLLLLQSCSVYNIPASADAAVAANKKVKVITSDRKDYKFNRLENRNDTLIGITRLRSSTAEKLAGMPAKINGKTLEIDLSNINIHQIRLKNESTSTILTVVTVVGALMVAILTIFALSYDPYDWNFDLDPE